MIKENSLLLFLFCGLVFAACTPTARPSQSAPVATAATAPETSAAAATTAAVAAESQPTDPSQEIVCKTFTPTGTRFQQRVCGTQAQWDRMQKDGRDVGENVQRKGVQVGNPTGN